MFGLGSTDRYPFMVVEPTGFEPVTSSMPSRRAPNCATAPRHCLVLVIL